MATWLGDPPNGSDEAMKFWTLMAALDFGEEDELALKDRAILSFTCRLGSTESFVETFYETLGVVHRLLNSTYCDRTWIMREARTPKDDVDLDDGDCRTTCVCCGGTTVS